MKKKIFFIVLIFLIILIFILLKFEYKGSKLGNNISEIDILDISSYDAQVEVEVYSNKNTNKYILNQKYKKQDYFKQEVLEPKALSGLTIFYDGTNVTVENKNLNLSMVYENLDEDFSNLSLVSFIYNYKNGGQSEILEDEEQIIMKAKIKDSANHYQMYQNLYCNKKTNLPTKMEILDINKNITVYILYNEITINKLDKKDIV